MQLQPIPQIANSFTLIPFMTNNGTLAAVHCTRGSFPNAQAMRSLGSVAIELCDPRIPRQE